MSKEVIAQYLADMEKDDFVFVPPTTTEAKEETEVVEAEAEVDMARVPMAASSWADEVEEEEIMAAEEGDAKPDSWATVAAAPPRPTGKYSRILQRNHPIFSRFFCCQMIG